MFPLWTSHICFLFYLSRIEKVVQTCKTYIYMGEKYKQEQTSTISTMMNPQPRQWLTHTHRYMSHMLYSTQTWHPTGESGVSFSDVFRDIKELLHALWKSFHLQWFVLTSMQRCTRGDVNIECGCRRNTAQFWVHTAPPGSKAGCGQREQWNCSWACCGSLNRGTKVI